MWLWQRKNIHKRHLLWAKLFGLCLLFHLIFLFWIFCVYRDNSYILSISVNKKLDYSAPIYFVPLGTPTTRVKPTQPKKSIPKKTVVAVPKPVVQNKTIVPTKKPTTVAAVIPKKTTEPIKKELPKTEIKKIEEVKKEIPKIEPKKEEPIKQKDDKPQEKTPSFDKLRTSGGDIVSPVAQTLDTQQTITAVIPENAQISHNYREVEALRRNAQLQKELVQKWKPPIGVSPDCMCEVSFFVNSTGAIEDLKMVKSSGVVMYDISARQALFAMKMPQWTHGKPFTISFKQ